MTERDKRPVTNDFIVGQKVFGEDVEAKLSSYYNSTASTNPEEIRSGGEKTSNQQDTDK